MATNNYDIGDIARLEAKFTSTGGVPADPTLVTFMIVSPSGVGTTDTSAGGVANPAVGTFTIDVPIDEAGVWNYRVSSTGVVTAADDLWFRVKEPRVP